MAWYGEIKGAGDVMAPGDGAYYRQLMRDHQANTSNAGALGLYMEADANNPDAVAYASTVNMRLRALMSGDVNFSKLPALPLPTFPSEAIRFNWRDRNGNVRFDQGVPQLNQHLHIQVREQQNEIGEVMTDIFGAMGQAMKKAEQNAPSDRFVSHIPQGQEYIALSNERLQLVVDKRDTKAVAWAQNYATAIKRDGFEKAAIPHVDFSIDHMEFRPPANASPGDVKDFNEFNSFMKEFSSSMQTMVMGQDNRTPVTHGVTPTPDHRALKWVRHKIHAA